ncbi:MAG: TagF domain-containing protein [Planctomycetota bacterium]|nr:TagF domain-containing protein [Planctomycetota bacterium]
MIELRPGWYGKVHDQGDFVALDVTRAQTEWIDQAVDAFSCGGGDLASTGPVCAALRRGDAWWLSAWYPSRDSVGRVYPLVAVAELPLATLDLAPAVASALFMPVFERMLAALPAACAGGDLAAHAEAVAAVIDPERVADLGHQRLEHETSVSLWQAAWGQEWGARSVQALSAFLAFQAEGHPLQCIEGVVSPGHVAFWYAAACLTRAGNQEPNLVVVHPTWSGGVPRMILAWDSNPDLLAACLWDGHWRNAWTPVRIPGQQTAPVPEWLQSALRQAGPSLRDLLYALSHPELA